MPKPIKLANLLLAATAFCGTVTNAAYANEAATAGILVSKSIQLEDDPMLTGSQVRPATYVITITNGGNLPTMENSIEIIDQLPENLTINNADFDGDGPGTAIFTFGSKDSGLTLRPVDVMLSSETGSFPAGTLREGADERVRSLRIQPRGAMKPGSSFTVTFRVFDVDKRNSLFEVLDDQNASFVAHTGRAVATNPAY